MVKQVGADQRDAWWERWGKWRVQTATRQACWTLARARYWSLPQQTTTTSNHHPIPHSPPPALKLAARPGTETEASSLKSGSTIHAKGPRPQTQTLGDNSRVTSADICTR